MRLRFIILPAFLALSLLAAHRGGLPDLPATVYSRYGPVPVTRVRVVVCPDSTGKTDPRTIGCFGGADRIIQIADTLDARWSWAVLFHEETHIAFRDVNLRFDVKEDEERIAWVVARWRLGELEGHP